MARMMTGPSIRRKAALWRRAARVALLPPIMLAAAPSTVERIDPAVLAEAARVKRADVASVTGVIVEGLGWIALLGLTIAGGLAVRDGRRSPAPADEGLEPPLASAPPHEPRVSAEPLPPADPDRLARLVAASDFAGLARRLAAPRALALPEREEIVARLERGASDPALAQTTDFRAALAAALVALARSDGWAQLTQLDRTLGALIVADPAAAAAMATACGERLAAEARVALSDRASAAAALRRRYAAAAAA